MTLVNEGRPIFVTGDEDRIGRGPWARWVATSVVPAKPSLSVGPDSAASVSVS